MPYISYIAWKCLRWIPVLPLGLSHLSTEDDEYKGYRIPKGTTVMPNILYACPLLLEFPPG